MGDIILKQLLKYVESHPEAIEKLVAALIDLIVKEISKVDPPKA